MLGRVPSTWRCRRLARDGLLNVTRTQVISSPGVNLTGTATDDQGVSAVRVAILENDTDRYLRANGTLSAGFGTINANLATPNATSTNWTCRSPCRPTVTTR